MLCMHVCSTSEMEKRKGREEVCRVKGKHEAGAARETPARHQRMAYLARKGVVGQRGCRKKWRETRSREMVPRGKENVNI